MAKQIAELRDMADDKRARFTAIAAWSTTSSGRFFSTQYPCIVKPQPSLAGRLEIKWPQRPQVFSSRGPVDPGIPPLVPRSQDLYPTCESVLECSPPARNGIGRWNRELVQLSLLGHLDDDQADTIHFAPGG